MTFNAGEFLRREFQALDVRSVDRLGEGYDHVAFLVNDELVFRLPWSYVEPTEEGASTTISTVGGEVAVLRRLAGRLPVAIPDPAFVAGDETYFGYRYLPGRPLDDVDKGSDWPVTPQVFADLIVDVALAIEEGVPVAQAGAFGLKELRPETDGLRHAASALGRGLLSPAARAAGQCALETFVERWPRAAASRLVTMHGDLALEHWLLDERRRVYALIDWSDACIAPPELQLSAVMWAGRDLVGTAASSYRDRTGHDVDVELVIASGYVSALGGIGELLEEDDPGNEDDLDDYVELLSRWSS